VRREILRAAGELLLAEGMAAFTIEKVAALAGASRVTLHKWWPSRGALALDGYFSVVGPTLAFPDTGDLAADLTTQLRAFVHLMSYTQAGRVMPELIGQGQTDPELMAAFRERYSAPRRALAAKILERARQRGELREDLDLEVVVDQLWGACYHRLLIPDQPLTDEFAETLVKNLLYGISRP
jgi:AcrR family transcriptional regulator